MKNTDIDAGKTFDWGRASVDYAKFRDIYPSEFYQRILDLGLCTAGQDVLDLGTGTGVLPRALYANGAKFVGADISGQQIAEARRLAEEEKKSIDFIVCAAEDLSFPPGSFDVITACQCFLYFNKSIVLPKFHQLLRTGGHFCELWMAWLPQEDEIAAASEKLVLKYNPAWTGAGYQRPVLSEPTWASPYFSASSLIAYDIPFPSLVKPGMAESGPAAELALLLCLKKQLTLLKQNICIFYRPFPNALTFCITSPYRISSKYKSSFIRTA